MNNNEIEARFDVYVFCFDRNGPYWCFSAN